MVGADLRLDLAARSDEGVTGGVKRDVAGVDPARRLAFVVDGTHTPWRGSLSGRLTALSFETFLGQHPELPPLVEDARIRLATAVDKARRATSESVSGMAALTISGRTAVLACFGTARCYVARGDQLHLVAPPPEREGAGPPAWVRVTTAPCEPGDTYLLCSDGVWQAVPPETLGATLRQAADLEDACSRLVGAVWAAGTLGSVAVALVRAA